MPPRQSAPGATAGTTKWCEAYEAVQHKRWQPVRAVERAAEERRKEERASEGRQRAATVGTGKLHAEIAAAAEQNGLSITRLIVLSTWLDPYRRDTTDRWSDAVVGLVRQHHPGALEESGR
jgi:hypothetical protein